MLQYHRNESELKSASPGVLMEQIPPEQIAETVSTPQSWAYLYPLCQYNIPKNKSPPITCT